MSAGRAVLGLTAPAPPPARRGMPTTGTVKVLALLIEFDDYRHSNEAATIAAKLFGGGVDAGQFPYESLHDYYQRSSYDQLDIQGDVLGWYRTAYARSSVVETDGGREALIEKALTYYEGQGHDFSQYDNNGDGTVDYLIVIWAGPQGTWSSFWWGYQTYFEDSAYALDGKTLETYSWQWESWYQGGTTRRLLRPDRGDPRDGARPRPAGLLRLRRHRRAGRRRRRAGHDGREVGRPQRVQQVDARLDHAPRWSPARPGRSPSMPPAPAPTRSS